MPKPFFTKLVAISAIGFFCVLFGCVFGIVTHDRLFIIMSLLLGTCSLIRAICFYHLIRTQAYITLEGICKKRNATLFGKNQQLFFTDDEGREYSFSLDKNLKLLLGHRYRLYFRKPPQNPNAVRADSSLYSGDFLGFEELTDHLPEISQSSV